MPSPDLAADQPTPVDTAPRWTPREGEQLELGEEPPVPPPRGAGQAAGRDRRDRGRGAAEANTWTPWRHKFEDALVQLASEQGRTFTSDDVLELCGEPLASSTNSVGALMSAAARRGLIVRVGFQQSRRPARHGGWVMVWRGAG